MTGVEMLRELGNDYAEHSWSEAGKTRGRLMLGIADQIERERACDEDAIENVRLIVGGVIDDMERHCLGHEGMEDSPVARWARELREALGGAVTDEDRAAAAWVCDHGGLDYVKREWRSRVPRDRYESRRQSLLGHIAECETALGRRREIISKLTHRVSDLVNENAELRRRAMPDGYEWPRYEGGSLLRYGDSYIGNDGNNHRVWQIRFDSNADVHVSRGEDGDGFNRTTWDHFNKGKRVKRPEEVLAADGEPLEVGQTVYNVNDGTEYEVGGIRDAAYVDCDLRKIIECSNDEQHIYYICFSPDQLTHTKPEPPDSWDALWDDIEDCAVGYESFMRRCRTLAERERGE